MDTTIFDLVPNDEILNTHQSLSTNKASGCDNTRGNIPPKMIRLVKPTCNFVYNRGINEATFLVLLKRAVVTPVFKKDNPMKQNTASRHIDALLQTFVLRPLNFLPNVCRYSKIF